MWYVGEITKEMIGKQIVKFGNRSFLVCDFMGQIYNHDVGKRVYLNHGVLQVENDEQRDRRLEKQHGLE